VVQINQPRFFYGWYIVLAGFLGNVAAGGIQSFTFGVIYPAMSDALGWGRGAVSIGLALRPLGAAFMGPIVGPLIDKFGSKWLMFFSAIIGGIATIAVAEVTQIWQFYVVYGIAGALTFTGVGDLVATAVIPKWFIRKRGRALGLATMGNPAAGMVVAPMLAFVVFEFGWQVGWWFLGLLILFLGTPAALLMRRQPEDFGLQPDGDIDTLEQSHAEDGIRKTVPVEIQWTARESAQTLTFWLLLLAFTVGLTAVGGVVLHEYAFLTERGLSSPVAAAVLSTHAVGAALARLLWGGLADKFPIRYVMSAIFFFSAFGLAILLVSSSVPFAFLFAAVYGLSVGGTGVVQPTIWANYFGRGFIGAIRGITMPAQLISVAAGPVMAGVLYDITGGYTLPYQIFFATLVIGGVIMIFTRQPVKR
tara:strand:+ start:1424 stop:2680 length:1257 start_codon:yes stop_codon:yes gene_type:complete